MKTILSLLLINTVLMFTVSCSPVKLPVANEYELSAYSAKQLSKSQKNIILLVTTPETVVDYQTKQMRYIRKPFQLEAFANNAWTSPPADMLEPLLVQSLQRSNYFYVVTSSLYNEKADYRLDTQLLTLRQNFLTNPSTQEFSAKVVLTRIKDKVVLGTKIICFNVPAPENTPYGGVLAANRITVQFTETVVHFLASRLGMH